MIPAMADRFEELLAQQVARLGDRPLLTFYDAGTGERTELGYATFANWAAKTANLLADEGVEPGDDVLVGVDGHWAGLVVVAACGLAGARAVIVAGAASEGSPGLAVVHERFPDQAAGGRLLLVGSGLGGRLTGEAPEGADVFVEEALACDDEFSDPEVAADEAWARLPDGTERSQADLLAAPPPPADRVLCAVAWERALPDVVAALAAGGSAVVIRGGDDALLDRLEAAERCGARVP